MSSRSRPTILLCLLCLLILSVPSYACNDTLERGKQLRFGELLQSASGIFKLGFFLSPDHRKDESYFGLWYDNEMSRGEEKDMRISNPLWIANRGAPIFNHSGILTFDDNGLKILSGEAEVITLHSMQASVNACVILQDNGNFVLRQLNSDGSVEGILWQSFEHPTDTLLPGMKLGITTNLTSWGSYDLPASGSFTLGLDPNGTKQLVIWRREDVYWRSGSWQEGSFDFQYFSGQDHGYNFSFTQNENKTYFSYTKNHLYLFARIKLGYHGDLMIFDGLISNSRFSLCSQSHDNAGCIKQKLPECRTTIHSVADDGYFTPVNGTMSTNGFIFSKSDNLTLDDCEAECLLNCSCFAYAATNFEDQYPGCEMWTSSGTFQEIHVGPARTIYILPSYIKRNKWWLWLTIVVGGILVLPSLFAYCYVKCISTGDENINQRMLIKELEGSEVPSSSFGKSKTCKKNRNDLHVFSFESIASATNYFSNANKLGEGGFGPVYKGLLHDGREVAIKRLCTDSGQGVTEFKNEAILIAKLQHTNLVRLLGFCIQGEEKILIYEYMPNKSLDSFLFDVGKKKILDWRRRRIIIEGIAQGLLYLHKCSRLRVIHRDLKAGNILLDNEMNPKISNFGMARIFGENESEENTSKIVGTYGYISPEYAFHGLVSTKTDVYSFGVLLLELVSGRKNSSCYHPEHPLNLVGYAWQLWNGDRALELIDPTLDEFCHQDQILRCIHIGLLCVQDYAVDRPTMSDVVSMLSNETTLLLDPKQPVFFVSTAVQQNTCVPKNKSGNCSINQVSISVMEAR